MVRVMCIAGDTDAAYLALPMDAKRAILVDNILMYLLSIKWQNLFIQHRLCLCYCGAAYDAEKEKSSVGRSVN